MEKNLGEKYSVNKEQVCGPNERFYDGTLRDRVKEGGKVKYWLLTEILFGAILLFAVVKLREKDKRFRADMAFPPSKSMTVVSPSKPCLPMLTLPRQCPLKSGADMMYNGAQTGFSAHTVYEVSHVEVKSAKVLSHLYILLGLRRPGYLLASCNSSGKIYVALMLGTIKLKDRRIPRQVLSTMKKRLPKFIKCKCCKYQLWWYFACNFILIWWAALQLTSNVWRVTRVANKGSKLVTLISSVQRVARVANKGSNMVILVSSVQRMARAANKDSNLVILISSNRRVARAANKGSNLAILIGFKYSDWYFTCDIVLIWGQPFSNT